MKGGNLGHGKRSLASLGGFNEAALHEGRKCPSVDPASRSRRSFNEAALHEGRKFAFGFKFRLFSIRFNEAALHEGRK